MNERVVRPNLNIQLEKQNLSRPAVSNKHVEPKSVHVV